MRNDSPLCQRHLARRHFLFGLGAGAGALAFSQLLAAEGGRPQPLAPKPQHTPAAAKACIFLFMEGGPSHIDTFDPKPKLRELHGQTFVNKSEFLSTMASGERAYVGSPFQFRQCGQAGLWMCDRFQHLPQVADDLCLYHGLQAESINHPTACLHMNTGNRQAGDPALGGWVTYGLGTANENLPAFVVLADSAPQGGASNWSNGFLPAHYQGTLLRSGANPILDLQPPPGVSREAQREGLDLLAELEAAHRIGQPHEEELAARLDSYELAFRMQSEAPAATDIDREPAHIRALYGLDDKRSAGFGRKCLLARRLVERGVRFVQVVRSGWDAHDKIGALHGPTIESIDRPIAGLIQDLKQRGLLAETLLVWCGEFGRSPDNGKGNSSDPGRDHNVQAMPVFLAGAGVKAGAKVGATDELGAKAVDCVHPLRDFHVTLLRLLGLEDNKLTYYHAGRFKQLSQTGGQSITELLAS